MLSSLAGVPRSGSGFGGGLERGLGARELRRELALLVRRPHLRERERGKVRLTPHKESERDRVRSLTLYLMERECDRVRRAWKSFFAEREFCTG